MAGSKKLEINDLEKLNGGDFKKLREALQSDFEGRVSEKAEYEDGSKYKYWEFGQKHWYIQIKTIWDDCVNHYEVIYEARTDPKNIKFIEDGVRVELHIEQWDDKMDDEEKKKMNKKALSLDKFLKDKDPYLEMENVNRDKKYEWHHNTHRWILKKNIEREGANKYDFYDIIKDELNRAIKILDPLISQFLLKDKCDELAELLKSNHNLILTGAPGTGKTFLAKQIASEIILGKMKEDEVKKSNIADYREFVQFHPSYDYTDFVEGLRPCIQKQNNKKANTSQDTVVESSPDPQTKSGNNGNIGFELRPGVFKEFCDNAKAQKDKSYVFIIDEINRGDISKIFGELFFSIDPEYRGEKGAVETQYSNMHDEPKEKFYVPENVYIIGTMNDIDRSVESMDFAMRRRFSWQEITAKESAVTMGLSDELKNRMKRLNDEIVNPKGLNLNSSFQIGGAYFLDKDEDYNDIWEMRLEPLLREYLRGQPNIEEDIKRLKGAYDGKNPKYKGNPSEKLAGLDSITGEDLLKGLFDKPHNRIWKMGDCQFGGDFWYVQVKPIWAKDVDIHYKVIYDARENIEGVNEENKDEGVRVELHLEGKYIKSEKYVNDFCNYLKEKAKPESINKEETSKELQWIDWVYGRKQDGRYKYIEKKIEKVDDIIDGFEYLMKIFDPLLAKYQPKMLKTRLEKTHNLILTGAPGTGKTYLARQIASQMILNKEYGEEKLENNELEIFNEHYEFVQFHPSYDYTDFVEGLRPTEPDKNGNISFELKAGVFKKFCAKALVAENFDKAWEGFLKEIKNKKQIEVQLCGENDHESQVTITLNENEDGIIIKDKEMNSDDGSENISYSELYNSYLRVNDSSSDGCNPIFKAIIDEMGKNYGLEEYDTRENKSSTHKKDTPFIMIIDEINRGDISKIFGELFFSIDPGYRGEKGAVETQYSNMHDEPKEKFYVPENVYIIGTMNDIDRSVESMDFAMRRRFTWQEIKAKDTQHMLDDLSNDEKMKGKNKMDPADIQLAKNRMDNLNDKISDEKEIGLNSAYHIGASYFMKLANYFGSYSERCDNLWKNHLEGVLREYLRGDDKIEEKMGKLKDAYDK